jgi:hypothetical protein
MILMGGSLLESPVFYASPEHIYCTCYVMVELTG